MNALKFLTLTFTLHCDYAKAVPVFFDALFFWKKHRALIAVNLLRLGTSHRSEQERCDRRGATEKARSFTGAVAEIHMTTETNDWPEVLPDEGIASS